MAKLERKSSIGVNGSFGSLCRFEPSSILLLTKAQLPIFPRIDCPWLPTDRDDLRHLHPISGAPPPRPCESVRSGCPRLLCQMASVLPLVVEVVGDRPSSQKRSFIVLLTLTDWGTHGDWRHRRGFEIQAARAVAQPIEARRSGADCPGMVAQPPISINFCLS